MFSCSTWLVVLLVQYYASAQDNYCYNNDSCVFPPACIHVEFEPPGANFAMSPFYDMMFSPVDGIGDVDNGCTTFFTIMEKKLYLLMYTQVFKNGSYALFKGLVGVVRPGVSRLEYITSPLGCSTCLFNDITIKTLQGPCEGVNFIYRCFIFGDCLSQYSGQPYWFASRTALASPADCCRSQVTDLARAQGLLAPCARPVDLPEQLHRRCVTRVHGFTAINAHLVQPEDALEL